jgi:hypothetical protein
LQLRVPFSPRDGTREEASRSRSGGERGDAGPKLQLGEHRVLAAERDSVDAISVWRTKRWSLRCAGRAFEVALRGGGEPLGCAHALLRDLLSTTLSSASHNFATQARLRERAARASEAQPPRGSHSTRPLRRITAPAIATEDRNDKAVARAETAARPRAKHRRQHLQCLPTLEGN